MTILECIDKYVRDRDLRMPIFTNDIYGYVHEQMPNVRKSVFNEYITRYAERNPDFVRFQKGIYYRTVTTPFGKAGINYAELVKRMYIYDGDEVFGYETGPSFMNKIGLTTQMPTCTYIATDKNKVVLAESGERIRLLKPVTTITAGNYRYLQLLDMLDNRMRVNIEVEINHYVGILRNYIGVYELSFEQILYFARYYRNDKIYRRIAELTRGEIRA